MMRKPDIMPLHARLTANALHYASIVSGLGTDAATITLLQRVAFTAMFRGMTPRWKGISTFPKLEPLPPERKDIDPLVLRLPVGLVLRTPRWKPRGNRSATCARAATQTT